MAPRDHPRDGQRPSALPRSRVTQALSLLGVAVGGLAAVVVVRELVTSWPEVERALRDATWAWLGLAAALGSLGMVSVAWQWGPVLLLVGAAPAGVSLMACYFVGEIGKYLPGGIWPVLGRGELVRRRGVPAEPAYTSVALSLALLYLAAALTLAGLLPFTFGAGLSSRWLLVLGVLPVGVAVLHPRSLTRLMAAASRWTGAGGVRIPAWRDSLLLMVRYLPCWLLIGTATWSVARSLTAEVSWTRMVFAATLSWLTGFVAVPVPAGAGIREAALLTACGLPAGLAAATAVGARMLFVLVDAVGASVGAVVLYRLRAKTSAAHGDASAGPPPDPGP